MKFKYVRLGGLLILMAVLWSACTYAISRNIRRQVDKALTFAAVKQNPQAYTGAVVIWGGKIVDIVNRQNGTDLILLQVPLVNGEQPGDVHESQGRYLARTSRFLDPEIYARGKKVTLAGEIVGREVRSLGELQYTYPVLQIRELRLWQRRIVYPLYSYRTSPWGVYDPFLWPYGDYPGPPYPGFDYPYPYSQPYEDFTVEGGFREP